ncbi:hypothetical protein [Aquariibacter albus]|uniref:Uncharacterized protein n=1 Tax=Aquariibacter albus TaxID=2759899 RepID=A0A839HTZ8_9BURK|nr:hypothetical protein [Aquariibacter albus]MBB1161494.1 hypothetical protein [Aquariibacter albus]
MKAPACADAERARATAWWQRPGSEQIREEAFNEAYDCARAGLAAGAPATQALLGELVLEGDDDLDMLMAAMRHAVRGDMQRAGVMVTLLTGAVLQRHAALAADLVVMQAEAASAVLASAESGVAP